ncbi:host-nuclease inhibitor Gam family protein [Pseudorhodoferax sp.]|uniref:host-nuclease inhibitor Gam family protein n=1 Tax=Pseudorhodoferax sp. TaxID=1993553 RepID=UPI002DD63D5A|nr:host-nuclease inhibitor Gam family protein [Pseudorhodoferax sp.]
MATRIKAKAAAAAVPQSKAEVAQAIRRLGDTNREFERVRTKMNDLIAAITEEFQAQLTPLADAMKAEQQGIQTWCEAHRVDLCGEADKLGKSANLVTGEVGWRVRPPSVRITNADGVIETLVRMNLHPFVRTRAEVNKEAILADPDKVRGIAGITVVRGVEDFFVVPFEATAEAAEIAGVVA